jgi:hypothetical protein
VEHIDLYQPYAITNFAPTTLKGLDKVKLMSRVDTKYAFHVRHLDAILAEVASNYLILEIDGKRVFDYASLYFDTPDFDYYGHHHSGRANRVKVRYREYLDTGDVFFEVKKKVKGSRTDKFRIKTPAITSQIEGQETDFLRGLEVHTPNLEGKIWIYYRRITLASKETEERVTIDLAMHFDDKRQQKSFPELVIAEIKQGKLSRSSPIVTALRRRLITPLSFSKYSLSVAYMVEGIKNNAFRSKIGKIDKILKDEWIQQKR